MKPLLIPILYFVGVIIIAHFFAPPGYVWTQNTISDLGSQGHVNKWIMQAGFIGFGILLTASFAWKWHQAGSVLLPDIPIVIYGLAVLMTGFFCAAPIHSSLNYSIQEAQLHSTFATIAGISLVAGILWNLFISPDKRGFHLLFLILITGISLLFGLAEGGSLPIGKGLIQRMLYLTSFIWLVFFC
jgi:hypothetical membrane protein